MIFVMKPNGTMLKPGGHRPRIAGIQNGTSLLKLSWRICGTRRHGMMLSLGGRPLRANGARNWLRLTLRRNIMTMTLNRGTLAKIVGIEAATAWHKQTRRTCGTRRHGTMLSQGGKPLRASGARNWLRLTQRQ